LAASPAFATDAQQRFLEALTLVNLGKPQEGAALLRQLYAEMPTARVRLELARALMLSGQLAEAKKLFIAAYKDNPPPVVKANILAFLSKIDRQEGKLSLSLSISRYGNPLQQPGPYSLSLGGIDLNYQLELKYRNLWGATASAQYRKELQSGLILSGTASVRALPYYAADRFAAEVSAGKKALRDVLEWQVGVFHLGQMRQSFTLPYVQAGYTYSMGSRLAIQPTIRLGYYAAASGAGQTGWQGEAFIPVVYAPTPIQAFAVGPTIVRHDVGFAEQSFTSLGVRAAATIRTERFNLEGGLQARLTPFDAVDPFWGARRKDWGGSGSVMISSDKVRIGPFLPAAGISCDLTQSTIRYYQQSNCDVLFEVRKIF
jgi:hypothetical protein